MRASQGAALVAAIGLAMGGRTRAGLAQNASPSWNDSRSRAIVELATQRRAQQLADTALQDYRADAQGYVNFLFQFGKGFIDVPNLVKVDQLAVEVYWHAPNLSKQRIIGRRDTTMLPIDIQYHRDHLGIVQNNFPDIIRLGDGDEVRDVPHPLSTIGLREYDFAITDSLTIQIPDREIHVLEVKVRPKDDRQPRVVGAVFIDPTEGQVVRMAFNFTHAAFLDNQLEDLAVVLDNALIGQRFWLPHRQEIEIRRTGTYFEFPVRGIIRGRWEIQNYRFNLNQPVQTFAGPEFSQAPLAEQRAYKWPDAILDQLPPDVRMATDKEVLHVQDEARALVRETALARPQRLVMGAASVSQLAHVNRVEGLAFGGGLSTRFKGGFSLGGNARYGIDSRQLKGGLAVGYDGSSRSGWRLFGSHEFREAGDVQERSTVVNSLGAQEFGSDFTDPYDVLSAGTTVNWRKSETVIVTLGGSFERQRALDVHAHPVTGHYQGTLYADPIDALRIDASLERPSTPWLNGTHLAATLDLRVQRGVSSNDAGAGTFFNTWRVFGQAELNRPAGSLSFRSWTSAGYVRAAEGASVPRQEELFFGGPLTAPGYRFHEFSGNAGFAQRLELRAPVPFPRVSLSRFGATPSRATLAPYVQLLAGPFACKSYGTQSGGAERRFNQLLGSCAVIGAPSVGVGLLSFYDVLRLDVAHGFRGNGWTFNIDVSRDFWRIL